MDLKKILKLPLKERLKKLRELYEQEEDPELLIHIASAEKELEQKELEDISHRLKEEKPTKKETTEDATVEEASTESIEEIVSDIELDRPSDSTAVDEFYQSSTHQQLYGSSQNAPETRAYQTSDSSSQDSYQQQPENRPYHSDVHHKEEKKKNRFGFEEHNDVPGREYHI